MYIYKYTLQHCYDTGPFPNCIPFSIHLPNYCCYSSNDRYNISDIIIIWMATTLCLVARVSAPHSHLFMGRHPYPPPPDMVSTSTNISIPGASTSTSYPHTEQNTHPECVWMAKNEEE